MRRRGGQSLRDALTAAAERGDLKVREQGAKPPANRSPAVEAALAERRRDFADPTPRPGSAAVGIVATASETNPDVMNATETAYSKRLDAKQRAGVIRDWKFGEWRFQVGIGSWYRPDFYVVLPDHRLYVVEVKPFRLDKATGEMIRIVNEDAEVKVRTCLLRHPFPILLAFGRSRGKQGHEFREEWAGGVALAGVEAEEFMV